MRTRTLSFVVDLKKQGMVEPDESNVVDESLELEFRTTWDGD